MLFISNLSLKVPSQTIIDRLNLEMIPGEIHVLLGASGSGKTSLLRVIAGLIDNVEGRLSFNEKVYLDSSQNIHSSLEHGKVQMMFQNYALFPHMNVFENIQFALDKKNDDRIDYVLKLVDLKRHEKKYPKELSGGEQQRLALARCIASPSTELILLDEPFANLDPLLSSSLRKEIREIIKQMGITSLIVTHDREEAIVMADRISVLDKGTILQTGKVSELIRQPISKQVAAFMGEGNYIKGRIQGEDVHTPIGVFKAHNHSLSQSPLKNGTQVEVLIWPSQIKPSLGGGELKKGQLLKLKKGELKERYIHGETERWVIEYKKLRLKSTVFSTLYNMDQTKEDVQDDIKIGQAVYFNIEGSVIYWEA